MCGLVCFGGEYELYGAVVVVRHIKVDFGEDMPCDKCEIQCKDLSDLYSSEKAQKYYRNLDCKIMLEMVFQKLT